MTARRALVTGASGQDGSYLVERLAAEGYEVHAVYPADEPAAEPDGAPAALVRHHADVADVEATRRLVLDVDPTEIYHLAALSSVAESWRRPDLTATVNGIAAVGLMESAWQLQERSGHRVAMVQASSAEIFGAPDASPQDESTPIRPVNPYGAAKAYAHLMAGVYRGRGLHVSAAILYNHESPRRPERFVTRKITAAAAAIATGRAEELTLGSLTTRRDWGWAPDYVDAMVRAARATDAGDYVVATGESRSIEDFVAAAFERAGIANWRPHVRLDAGLARPVEATELTGDASRARERLGWAPTKTFEDVVAAMVDADLARWG